ncbi:MAG: hypothetical protein MUO40_12750 [Anaerolineaceae bacterium]|nr:hypothetical protein [Anaerolineaceae bacterium]
MKRTGRTFKVLAGLIVIVLFLQACNIPFIQKIINPDEPTTTTTTEETSEVFIPIIQEDNTEESDTPTEEAAETPQAPEPTATAITHIFTPAEPGWVSKYFYDTDSSTTAANKSAGGGDDYYSNKYERPFSQNDMVYYPDLDIQKAEISVDDNFYYISITVKGLNPTSNSLTGTYGAELDTDLDGRGDYLFYCDLPNFTDWSINTVHAFKDANNDVGGTTPTYPDTGTTGDGYETLIFSTSMLDDPDGLWCRKRAGSDIMVDLAIHKTLIGSPGQFAWGVWTDLGLKQPGSFDYNDHFTFDQAGSPMAGNNYYPIKDIHSLDNTCREAFGFEPSEFIPGMCFVPTPTPTTAPPDPTATLPPRPGTVSGIAFYDRNSNGVFDAGEPETVYSVTIRVYQGFCSGGLHVVYRSTTNKTYSFTMPPGNYCIYINPTYSDMTTPYQYSITIVSSTNIPRNFGYNVIN